MPQLKPTEIISVLNDSESLELANKCPSRIVY